MLGDERGMGEKIEPAELTPIEENVLRMMVGNMSDGEIAFALDIADDELERKSRTLFAKLGVRDRTSATQAALERGMIRTDL